MKKFRGFDSRAIKQFFILNVEKIVFGVSMLLVALFIYGAISQEPYAKTPDDLRAGIKSAQDNMQKIDKIPGPDDPPPPRFVEMASRGQDEVPATGFETKIPWSFDKNLKMGTRRGEPILLAVRDLETTAGTGPFALKGDPTKRFDPVNSLQPGQPAAGNVRPGMPNPAANPTKRPPAGRPNRPGSLMQQVGGEGVPNAAGGEGQVAYGQQGAAAAGPRGVQAAQDSVVEGVRWICVTGLVPYREQIARFNDEFATAQLQDPAKDFPFWAGYLVERAEVTQADLKDPSKSKWEKLSDKDMRHLTTRWSSRAPEVVDPAYTDEFLTFPLGPLLEKNWDKKVAHSKIPALDITQRGASAGDLGTLPESAALADQARVTEGNDLDAMRLRRRTASRAGGGGEGMASRTVAPRTVAPRNVGGSYPGGGEGYVQRGPRGFSGQGEGQMSATAQTPQELEFLLFRFFDFTVEEGKQYRYRVQLVLENPNYNLRQQYLKDAGLAKLDLITGPMSEPSPVAAVETFNELYVGPVRAADKPVDEPKVRLIAVQLDPKLGTKAVYEMRPPIPGNKQDQKRVMQQITRGQLIQFQAKIAVVHPLTRQVEDDVVVDFNANKVVLDIRGGERFSPNDFRDRETIPGEVLFMDAKGFLTARSETIDELDYLAEVEFLKVLDDAKASRSTIPVGGAVGGEGGEGAAPVRGRAGAGS